LLQHPYPKLDTTSQRKILDYDIYEVDMEMYLSFFLKLEKVEEHSVECEKTRSSILVTLCWQVDHLIEFVVSSL
jgi:hypothetical protein